MSSGSSGSHRPERRGLDLPLVLVLVVGALLRFWGLSWGLQHPPHPDERVFVENAQAMLEAGDFDHRFYEYPGLFFYLLAAALWLVPGGDGEGARAYLVARTLVALVGVAAVALLYAFSRRLLDRRSALLAALLLAVSPVAVETAHMVRPDVVLQAFVLVALLAMSHLARPPHALCDVWVGLALGLAGAVKFSAIFLVPVYLLRRLLLGGPLARQALVVAGTGVLAVTVFVAASPYAALHLDDFASGVTTQVAYHYEGARLPRSWFGMWGIYTGVFVKALGPAAAGLAVAGIFGIRHRLPEWAPWLLLPLIAVAVLATSDVHFDRFLLPFLVVGFPLAAAGSTGVPRRWWPLLAALAVLWPLLDSVRYDREVARPGTRDRLLAWSRSLPEGTRVFTTLELIGFDRRRLEVLQVRRPAARVQTLFTDVTVLTPRDDTAMLLQGLDMLLALPQTSPFNGPDILVAAPPASLRDRVIALPTAALQVSATDNPAEAPLACDGKLDTAWRTSGAQVAGDTFALRLEEPHTVAAVELRLGDVWKFAARELHLEVETGPGTWKIVRTVPGRPDVDGQHPGRDGYSQLLLLPDPATTRALRLVATRNAARRWAVAEVRVYTRPGSSW